MDELYARTEFNTRTQRVRAGDLVTASVLADALMSEAELIERGYVGAAEQAQPAGAESGPEIIVDAPPVKPAKRR